MAVGRNRAVLLVLVGGLVGFLPVLLGAQDTPPPWVSVNYRSLVDLRQPSHSGETVADLWVRLGGRTAAGANPEDAAAHALLDPLLEPMAFVLPDVLDRFQGVPDKPLVEVGSLFPPGWPEPAWAELLRSRRFLIESDGEGGWRAFLPWIEGESRQDWDGSKAPSGEPQEAARQAWDAAWPVIRHVLAAERRRLKAAGKPDQPVQVAVFPYLHFPARGLFFLGTLPYQTTVRETAPPGNRPPLDTAAFKKFFEAGLQLEGGRLAEDGSLNLLGSPSPNPPRLLDQPLGLADAAVAYRAVFHGGRAEPYMSLDRGFSPPTLLVNYGGRLRDTRLGWVSLLCDIRFKTFSLGFDITTGEDVRSRVRAALPEFRTHLERFSADPGSKEILGQQTRLWFYPDAIEMVLSARGDAFLIGRARMSAASERVGRTSTDVELPPWTKATVGAINRDYDALQEHFPELRDLDQVVRWLSLFSWLRQARDEGLLLPDLDALLAVELPPAPTPRSFPQMLTFNALPPVGSAAPVEVLDQGVVGETLDRLDAPGGLPLPPRRRFQRALAALNPRLPEQAELAREMEIRMAAHPSDAVLDDMAYRAERLRMHNLVLTAWRGPLRDELKKRTDGGEKIRVFSIGIGGIDLGMGKAVAKATRRSQRLGWGTGRHSTLIGVTAGLPASGLAQRNTPQPEWQRDPVGLPETMMPDHGFAWLNPLPQGSAKTEGAEAEFRRFERGWVQRGRMGSGPESRRWWQWVLGPEGAEVRSRRVLADAKGLFQRVERGEGSRLISYRWKGAGALVEAEIVNPDWPENLRPLLAGPAIVSIPANQAPQALPEGLALGALVDPGTVDAETATIRLRLTGPTGKSLEGPIPRPVLQRVVAGREFDPSPERPLPGLQPLPAALGEVRTLMLLGFPGLPFLEPEIQVPGEEDSKTVALALNSWMKSVLEGGGKGYGVVLGVDSGQSPARWARAQTPVEKAFLLVPEGAFPAPNQSWRTRLTAAWAPGKSGDQIPDGPPPDLVILAGAEDPGFFSQRLVQLSRDPRLKGKRMAALSLSGPIRLDTAARILAEGNVTGLGLAEATQGRWPRLITAFSTLAREMEAKKAAPEQWKGPFLWIY